MLMANRNIKVTALIVGYHFQLMNDFATAEDCELPAIFWDKETETKLKGNGPVALQKEIC
jgi:hypothetical protein